MFKHGPVRKSEIDLSWCRSMLCMSVQWCAHLNEPGLALTHKHAVKVELFVREFHLGRGDVGLEKHHRLRTVFDLNRQLQ